MGDRNISVHADGHKAQDGGGAGPHIQRQPDEAQVPPKHPAVHNLIDCGEWEDQHS